MPPRLKSLELHGYKTFASKTNFSFPGLVTAIVGPNGSGKSNIADALRWVLGEQSYSMLRGRRTEDMIFAGSEQRSRAGMASATINFDNEDGWLPIDFSEVAITRRAYRDGQNEYLINGQRVRLREISELLAQSGLAERTYTIIGQGMVDAALALKPEERRRLFEEAAGIGLYRSRREEAINRLDSTSRNLERIQDILAELEPRLKSLERQAKRAQEVENLRADLQDLLRDWYGFHWLLSQREVKRSTEILRQQENNLQKVRDQRTAVSEEIGEIRRQITDIRNRLNSLHAQAATLHQQLEQASRSLAILDERKRALLEQKESLFLDLTRLETEIKDWQARYKASSEVKNQLQLELEDNQKRANEAQTALKERQKERREMDISLSSNRQNLIRMETSVVKQNARKTELEDRLEGLKTSLGKVEQAALGLGENAAKFAKELEEGVLAQKSAEANRRRTADLLQKSRAEQASLESERHKLQSIQSKYEGDTARLNAQIDVLDQAQKTFSGLSEGARFIHETRKQGKIAGRVQSLSSLLEVPEEFEVAISAALGEYLDLVLLEKDVDPDQVLELLQSNDKGRAAILPVSWARSSSASKEMKDDEYIGLAYDLVACTQENRNIVKAVLGNTFIVRNRLAARRILEGQPSQARAVTLSGEVFYPNGAVLSGRHNKGSSVQFSRPRQIKGLRDAQHALEVKSRENTAQLGKLEQSLSEHREELKVLEHQHQQAIDAVEIVANRIRSLELNHEQSRRQIEWHQQQHLQFQAQVLSSEKEISDVIGNTDGIVKEVQTLRSIIHEMNTKIAGLPEDELRVDVAHWETASAVARRAYSEENKRNEEIQHDLIAAQKRAEDIGLRIQNGEESLVSIDRDRNRYHDEESRLNAEVIEISKAATPEEVAIQTLEESLDLLQGDDLVSQQALTSAERQYTQAQLDASKARENADQIRRRAEEDFGLVSFDSGDAVIGQEPLPLEGMVEQLPALETLPAGLDENISRIKAQIRRIGAVNPEALSEFKEVQSRYHFMKTQVIDLHKADNDLRLVIGELDDLMKREFRKTFDAVAIEFHQMFTRLFGGGKARLVLTDEDQPIEAGIDIEARLPGRREQGLSLLSGGERSLAAVALVFSLLKVSPTPFCVLDEVDAMLDEANVGRFRELLQELSETTQFVVITHNRNTIQAADVIYGVTMNRDSASQVISLKLEEVPQEMVQ